MLESGFIQTSEQVFLIITYISHMLSIYITNNSYHLLITFFFFFWARHYSSSFNPYKNPMEWLLTLVFLFYCHANWVTERLCNQHKVIQPINGKLYPVWFLEPSRCLWIHLDLTRAFCVYITAKNAEKSDDIMKLLDGSIHLQKFKLGTKTLVADHLIKEVIFYFTLHFSRIVGEHQAF